MEILKESIILTQFMALLALVLIDVVGAVGLGLKTDSYDWGKLLKFLKSEVAVATGIWLILSGLGWLANWREIIDEGILGLAALNTAVYAGICSRVVASIYKKLEDLGLTRGVGELVSGVAGLLKRENAPEPEIETVTIDPLEEEDPPEDPPDDGEPSE